MSLPFTGGGRRCGTCRFYRPSPIPGQGWCTHPELVKPPAMVLVKARELNCARPLSEIPDRWEPADPRHAAAPRPSLRIRAVAPEPVAPPRQPATVPTRPLAVDPSFDLPEQAAEAPPELGNEERERAGAVPPTPADPFPAAPQRSARWLAVLAVPLVLCLLLGIGGTVGFLATNGFGTGLVGGAVATPTRPAGVAGIAKQDFRLRSEARSDSEQRSVVRSGTRLRLINSAAGEILDPTLPEPAKWYLVQTADGTAQGWAYSGWIERQS
ncbi:MAG: SH3 domain-containing protein [Chloroflexota bacterium]|nr:SH3 domain-containing protein [Dehalococcoidia bacterium]MDW8253613.1 SH3 domain-containing protein [Chloroflexota bacterium]